MSMTKRFTAFVLALVMMLGCITVTGFADADKNATFTIKMGKVIDGAWTETTEVNPGDDVVARVFLTTDFYSFPGAVQFFYDADFYEDSYSMEDFTTVNPVYRNDLVDGFIVSELNDNNTTIQNRTNARITAEQQARYNWLYIVFAGGYDTTCTMYDTSEYLFDIELKVKDNASGSGYFTVLPEVAASPVVDGWGMINLSVGESTQGVDEAADMYEEEVNIAVSPADGAYMEIPESENKLVITTKFFREDGGEWVETTKAKRGETLKARVYLDSAYPTNSGELMFFYDNTFFTNAYTTGENSLTVNAASGSFTAQNNIEGWFYTAGSTGAQAKVAKMVNNGYISQDVADANDYFYVIYEFGTGKTNTPAFDDDVEGADATVDNDLWFCEFELTVADNATDEGDLVVNPDTIATEQNVFGAVNVPKGYENSYNTYGMWLWDAEVDLYSNPVSLTSTVTFKLDGGKVGGVGDPVVVEDYIGSTYTVPAPEKDGSTFLGWYVEGDASETLVDPVDEIPYDDITYVAKWTENITVTFKDSEDDSVTYYTKSGAAGSEFPQDEIANPTKENYGFAGWATEPNGTPVALPSVYPDDDAVYYALWEANSYPVTYTIKNEVTGATVTRERYVTLGDVIPTENIYEVPEGYVFDGWYTDANCGTPFVDGTTMPASAQFLYAKLTADTYTVTFDLNGGNIDGDETDVEKETPYMGVIEKPADPVRDHYTFKGWSPALNDGTILDEPADRTYVATWESDPYTITFYKSEEDQAAGTVYDSGEYKPGVAVDPVADPHIDGQTFTSWKYYDETGTEINFTGTMPEMNVIAVAQYTPIVYTLTINYVDEEGNAVEADPNPYVKDDLAYGDTYSVASPTVEGFELVDDAQATISGTVDLEEPETEIEVNVVYKRSEFTITWILNGGNIDNDEGPVVQTYAFGANVTAPADPERTGYHFDGWDQDTPATMPAQNLERTAQWTANNYNVTFHLEGGKFNDSTDDVVVPTAYDSAISLLDPAPERDGYTFQGWSLTSGGAVLTDLGTMDDVNGKEFYAVWLADEAPYYIDVYYMGTDGEYPDSPSQTYAGEEGKVTGDTVSTTSDAYAKEGFTFDDAAANILEGEIPATGELRLQVYYKRDRHNVKFYVDGSAVQDDDLYYEEAIAQPDPAPEKEGYTFKGWSDTEGGTTPVTVADKMGTEDLAYYAIFEINKHNLTINYVDGEGNAVPGTTTYTEEVEYGTEYSKDSPTVPGYHLVDNSQATVSGTMPDDDVTVNVVYELNKWTLTINYVDEEGNAVPGTTTYTEEVEYGKDYSKDSPTVTGYHLVDDSQATVAGSMPDENTTVDVKYALNEHTVTWKLDGGNIDNNTDDVVDTYKFGDEITEPSAPEKYGYEFDKWSPEFVTGTTMPDEDLTYTATYKPKELKATFDLQGGKIGEDAGPVEKDVNFNDVITAPDGTLEKVGSEFLGWAAEPNGTKLDDLGIMDDENGKVFYALWSTNSYPLTIHYVYADGGEAAPDYTDDVEYGTDYSVDSPVITGFSPDVATVTGTMDDVNGKEVTVTYAAGQYTLTVNYYKEDGTTLIDTGAANPYTETVDYGESYSVTSPTVIGYTPDRETVTGTMDSTDGKTENVVYSPNPHTITWKLDGGKVDDSTDDIVSNAKFGDQVSTYKPADPEKEGYTFTGWTPELATTVPDSNLEYTATYTPNQYDATFKLQGGKLDGSEEDKVVPTDYDSDIADPGTPERDGYTFDGWSTEPNGAKLDNLGKMDTTEGKTFYALWIADNAPYYIDVYRMGTDGTYPAEPSQTYNGADDAHTDDNVSADPADYLTTGFTYDDTAVNELSGTIPATGDPLRLKIYYKRNQQTVKFMDGADEISSEELYYESPITEPEKPTKEGYTCTGWTDTPDGTDPVTVADKVGTEDLTYYALWSKNTYDVIYKFDDAKSNGNPAPVGDVENTYTFEDVEFEAALPEINNPVAEGGYSFVDWVWYSLEGSEEAHGRTAPNTEEPGDTITYDGRTGTKIAKPTTVPASDVLAVAYFKAPGEAEFYYGKNEAGQDEATRVYETSKGADGEAITAPATDPTIDGYTFDGWYVRGDDGQPTTGDKVTDFGNYETGKTKKFVAKWTEIPAYADFYANEGTWSTGDEPLRLTGVHSQAIEEPSDSDGTLSRDGYTFKGWGDSADATTPVDSLGNYDRNSVESFYAIWEQNKVTFDANGGKIDVDGNPVDDATVTGYNEGDNITDRVNEPTRPGYTFDGWYDAPEGGNEVDGVPADMPGGDLGTVYAHWKENGKQNINYYDDEGNLIEAVPVPEGAETPELGKDNDGNAIDPSKPGKEFVEWVDADGNPVTLPSTMPSTPINVYAKYNDVDYTLKFDPNGGDWGNGDTEAKTETKHYGDTISKPADPAAPDENHYFAGWSLDGTNVVNVESTMPANDLTYIAVWKELADKYTVTYKDSDGTTIETKDAREGDPVPKISNPSKPGYVFTGWKWTDASGKEIDTPYTMPGENIVATATYAPIRSTGSALVVVGSPSARDGSPNEYSGEYGGEYSAPGYSMKSHIDAARPAEQPERDHGEAIPQTGSNETAAIFAVVSAAAAAAYVVFATKTKKKEDEE